jgi:hypothetical protein
VAASASNFEIGSKTGFVHSIGTQSLQLCIGPVAAEAFYDFTSHEGNLNV